ncbi:hypothetical protein ABZ912_45230 [Nonomuraea angiospora]
MPTIQLTAPSGALPNGEGAPDTAFLRAQAWSHLTEPPTQASWRARR